FASDNATALTPMELVTFCILLVVAGNETTTNLVANAVLAPFDHPDARHQLEAERSLAAAVVEETLRYDNPGQGLIRVTTTDAVIGPVAIPAGRKARVMVGCADVDTRRGPDP